MNSGKIVVCGGGGFIGGHLVMDLLRQGCKDIRSVDVKPMTDVADIVAQALEPLQETVTAAA